MPDRRAEIAVIDPAPSGTVPATATLRDATPDDADAIAILDAPRLAVDPDEIRPAIRRDLDGIASGNRLRTCVVAALEGRIVGYGRAGFNDYAANPEANGVPSGWYLTGIMVDPDHRRRGLGSALSRLRLQRLRDLDAAEVHSFTGVANVASIALHERLGFVEVARGIAVPRVSFAGGVGILFRRRLGRGVGI